MNRRAWRHLQIVLEEPMRKRENDNSPEIISTVQDHVTTEPNYCKSCSSENVREFRGEIAIHFPGLKGLDQPTVWVFPRLLVCLKCGTAEFAVPAKELTTLAT
jgi:hypothetical protein